MKIVQVFKTDDGRTFDNRLEARKHEVGLETLQKLANLLKDSIQTGRPDSILRQILMENSAMSEILASYRKRLPKDENIIAVKKEGNKAA